jgi:hypothetical protein
MLLGNASEASGLKVNGNDKLEVYPGDINLIRKRTRDILLNASKNDGQKEMQKKLSTWSCLVTRTQDKFTIPGEEFIAQFYHPRRTSAVRCLPPPFSGRLLHFR